MPGLFKKFSGGGGKKKQKERPPSLNERSSPLAKEVQHQFVDSLGGLTFPTSPTKRNALSAPASRRSVEPNEFTILWSRPSLHRNIKVNPIFVNEPTQLYEGAFIPPDNVHDFGAFPRYRVNEQQSLYDDDVEVVSPTSDEKSNSLYRSRSLGAIPSHGAQNQGMNLAEVKKRRREENPDRGRLFGVFQSQEDLINEPSFNTFGIGFQRKRDSGMYPHSDENEDSNLHQSRSSNLAVSNDSGTFSNEDQLEETMLESSLIISALESSKEEKTQDQQEGHNLFTTNRGRGKERHTSRKSLNSETADSMFFISQTSFSGPSPSENLTEDTEHKSGGHEDSNRSSATKKRSHIDIHLAHNSNQDADLHLKDRFARSPSPILASVPRGRVSSMKYNIEGTAPRSKSVSNLHTRRSFDQGNERDDDDDDDEFESRTLKTAASFGHIGTNNLDMLLDDHKFFKSAIVSKNVQETTQSVRNQEPERRRERTTSRSSHEGHVPLSPTATRERLNTADSKHTKVDILTNNNETFRVVRKSIGQDDRDEEKAALVRQRLGISDTSITPNAVSTPALTVADLNAQARSGTPSGYRHSEGTFNILTGAGVTILNTNNEEESRLPLVNGGGGARKKWTVDELLRSLGRSVFPDLVDGEVYPDRACKRTIMQLMVHCYNHGSDCDWTGELNNLQDHLDACQKTEVTCENSCGRTDIPRNQMSQHTGTDGDCPLAVVLCRYHDVGCKHKARRVDIDMHYQESMEVHLDFAHSRIRELEVRQENICMNGKFLWKISNYETLVKQSASKKDKEKLCSPPFYTGQYGYKLRAEAFLNGLGQGKGSHLSLYVVIMKGEYDAILPWPFKQNVDFVLIDQDDDKANRQNKVWKLSCERNSDYFQRPNKAKSLGFGCPKFVSLDTLKARNYIRDQTIFIKIEVESSDHLIFAPVAAH